MNQEWYGSSHGLYVSMTPAFSLWGGGKPWETAVVIISTSPGIWTGYLLNVSQVGVVMAYLYIGTAVTSVVIASA